MAATVRENHLDGEVERESPGEMIRISAEVLNRAEMIEQILS